MYQSIDLEEPGNYELRFYAYLYCNNDCQTAGDSIKIILSEISNEIGQNREVTKSMTIDYDNIGEKRVWHQKFIRFTTENSKIEVKAEIFYFKID